MARKAISATIRPSGLGLDDPRLHDSFRPQGTRPPRRHRTIALAFRLRRQATIALATIRSSAAPSLSPRAGRTSTPPERARYLCSASAPAGSDGAGVRDRIGKGDRVAELARTIQIVALRSSRVEPADESFVANAMARGLATGERKRSSR